MIRIPRFNKKFPVHEHVPWNENCGKDSVFFLFRSWIFLWYSSLFVSSAKLNVYVIVSLSGSFKNI